MIYNSSNTANIVRVFLCKITIYAQYTNKTRNIDFIGI